MSWTVCSAQNGSVIRHYGVLGMKWGVRKDHIPTKRKERVEYEDVTTKDEREQNGYSKTITSEDNNKTTIRQYGTSSIEYIKEVVEEQRDSRDLLSDEEASKKFQELPKLDKPTSRNFNEYAVNKGGPTPERLENCFECVVAYEMRTRGYDVQANTRNGGLTAEYTNAFEIKDFFSVKSTTTEEAYKRMAEECLGYGEGARGGLAVSWPSGGAHAMSWEVKNGEFFIFDTQGTGRDGKAQFMGCDPSSIAVVRFDNAEVLPGIANYVEDYEGMTEEEFEEETPEDEKRAKKISSASGLASKILEENARAASEKQRRQEEMEKNRIEAKKKRQAKVEEYKAKLSKKKSTLTKVKETAVKVAKATGEKISEYASKGAKYIADFFDKS